MSLTTAAIGQQVKALEDSFGLVLFDRRKRSPQLNHLGQALVPRAREIVHAYDNLASGVTEQGALPEELTLGAVDTAMSGLVPRVLVNLKQKYQRMHVRVVPGLSGELYPQVDRGALDAAIISEPRHVYEHLLWRPFAEEPLILIAPVDAGSDNPRQLLADYPYIRFSRRAWIGEHIDDWLIEQNIRVKESMELTTLESISNLVSHNLGVSIVPRHCVQVLRSPPLKTIVLGTAARPRILGVLSRRDSRMFAMLEILHAEISDVVENSGKSSASECA